MRNAILLDSASSWLVCVIEPQHKHFCHMLECQASRRKKMLAWLDNSWQEHLIASHYELVIGMWLRQLQRLTKTSLSCCVLDFVQHKLQERHILADKAKEMYFKVKVSSCTRVITRLQSVDWNNTLDSRACLLFSTGTSRVELLKP